MDEFLVKTLKQVLVSEFSLLDNQNISQNNFIKIPNNPEIGDCMERIIKENKLQRNNFQQLSKLYFFELIILLSRYISRQLTSTKNLENDHLKKAMNTIHANYCGDFSVAQLAKECKVSDRYLRKLFRFYLESTPQEYCNNLKIKKATELLADRNIPVKEVAYSVGYSTPQYFSRMFKEKYGFSPQTYRKILFSS
jgi:transcriptional regulator GlxA family with amidase domain